MKYFRLIIIIFLVLFLVNSSKCVEYCEFSKVSGNYFTLKKRAEYEKSLKKIKYHQISKRVTCVSILDSLNAACALSGLKIKIVVASDRFPHPWWATMNQSVTKLRKYDSESQAKEDLESKNCFQVFDEITEMYALQIFACDGLIVLSPDVGGPN